MRFYLANRQSKSIQFSQQDELQAKYPVIPIYRKQHEMFNIYIKKLEEDTLF